MSSARLLPILCLLFTLVCSGAAAISTSYRDTGDYTDFEFTDRSGETGLRSFDRELKDSHRIANLIGERHLHLEFVDIDLAGRILPARGTNEVRVIRAVYPPRLSIRYKLQSATGELIDSGEAKLSGLDFMRDLRRTLSSGTFFYEITLLEAWLKKLD